MNAPGGPPTQPATHARFLTTDLSLLAAIADGTIDGGSGRRDAALETMVQRVWPPIYAAARRMGHDAEAAAELTQGFFVDVVLGRGLLAHADPERGRLRGLLLRALRHYAIDRHRRRTARPDGDGLPIHELHREESMIRAGEPLDAEMAFDRRWAMAMLEEALARCEQRFRRRGLDRHWAAFERFDLWPSVHASERPAHAQVAAAVGFSSAAEAANAVSLVRRHLRAFLREVVGETVREPEAGEREHRWLLQVLGVA